MQNCTFNFYVTLAVMCLEFIASAWIRSLRAHFLLICVINAELETELPTYGL